MLKTLHENFFIVIKLTNLPVLVIIEQFLLLELRCANMTNDSLEKCLVEDLRCERMVIYAFSNARNLEIYQQ